MPLSSVFLHEIYIDILALMIEVDRNDGLSSMWLLFTAQVIFV